MDNRLLFPTSADPINPSAAPKRQISPNFVILSIINLVPVCPLSIEPNHSPDLVTVECRAVCPFPLYLVRTSSLIVRSLTMCPGISPQQTHALEHKKINSESWVAMGKEKQLHSYIIKLTISLPGHVDKQHFLTFLLVKHGHVLE